MTSFVYRAVDASGVNARGVIEAPGPAAARRMLRDRALLPISVEPASKPLSIALPFRRGSARIGARALATVTRQISTLVSSHVNIEEALNIVAQQAENAKVAALTSSVRDAIMEGRSFAAALGDHPQTFPEFYRASVSAGEQSGRLAEVLAHLAVFVETRQRNQQKVKLALLYPALLAVVALGMIAMLLVYVVPDIVRVFVSRGAELPFLTRALIAFSDAVEGYGLYAILVLLIGGFLFGRWAAVPANRLRLDAFWSRTWPIARFSRQNNAARFAGSLATLTLSAVPLADAIDAAAAVTPNRHLRTRAFMVGQRIREGASLRSAMSEAGIFPSMLLAIVASGESSGQLGPALDRAATELERELDAMVSTLVALVEPGVLLLMGGIVLLMVLAILLPIINLNNLVTL
ncbi:type II secretion system F family protein [Sphingomonas naphthae]|uniref:General secretion pathway protein F n=1 Tax=Sphingomonas naphthae TaxID=1813468 RepID=A0ABY7TID1_9SPHN|nr:type II secretion system F family protein [Sphingomonas naphthae]WCT72874.1 type II secretion system F family protein [Sphingomonas naphthae]